MLSCYYKGFIAFLPLLRIQVAQTWIVLHETSHTTLFGTYYYAEVVRIENQSHMLEITCQVPILRIFKRFCHFCAKVAQTWFVLRETWHTTLFGIYYCVEVVRIENHSHMLEITC